MELIINNNNITIKNSTDVFKKWVSNKYIHPNPEYANKKKMGFWVGKTPKSVSSYSVIGDDIVLGIATLNEVYALWGRDFIKITNNVTIKTDFSDKINEIPDNLYDYQKEAVKAILKTPCGVLIAPAGSGKTFMACTIAKLTGLRVLWLCHTRELMGQAINTFKKVSVDDIGVIGNGKREIKKITCALKQNFNDPAVVELCKNNFDMVIIDEVHNVAGNYENATAYFKILQQINAPLRIGITATLERVDGFKWTILENIGPVRHEVPKDAVAENVLDVEISILGNNKQYDLSEYTKTDYTIDFNKLQNMLAYDDFRNDIIADLIITFGLNDRHIIVLTDRVDQHQLLYEKLPVELREKAALINGKTAKKKRDKMIEELRDGTKTILIATYALAKEGLDIPILDMLILASPKKTPRDIIQSIGRIARKHPNKTKKSMVWDIVDTNINVCVNMLKSRKRIYKKEGYIVRS